MPLAARILLGVFGLVVAVYAAASITGNWLSTPPWWEQDAPMGVLAWLDANHPTYYDRAGREVDWRPVTVSGQDLHEALIEAPRHRQPRPCRELISVGVGAVGILALAFAAWPRRKPGGA